MKKKPDNKVTLLTRSSAAEYLTFITAKGEGGVEAIYADEDVWLSQKMMAALYDVDVRTINYHLQKVFKDSELAEEAVIRKFRITATDGKNYDTGHYNLSAIIAVGYKVNSERAVQFRKWATIVVKEYTVKGFAMDDERLKAGGTVLTKQYFEEQLQRVREIRLSERKFYQKITDIYATSIDYDPTLEISLTFFKTVQNKMHWAITGQTAAEIVHARADADKPHMGLTTWRGARVRKQDVGIAKNYLAEDELRALNNLAEQYLIFAEGQAMRRIPMHMRDWIRKLDGFLNINDRDILTHAGKISHEMAQQRAEAEYEQYHRRRIAEQSQAVSDFDRMARQLTNSERGKKKP